MDRWIGRCFDDCRTLQGLDLDIAHPRHLWQSALALPESSGGHVWLHGDLKPTNLLVRRGGMHAVIDFGSLSVGFPDAEHAPVWDLPAEAGQAYLPSRPAGRLDRADDLARGDPDDNA
ncbi:phosphotransferase [Embleya sp. NPDC055664]